jgi:DNA-directed RNA polymerase beta subunit
MTLIPESADSLLAPPKPKPLAPAPPEMRSFNDPAALRKNIYDDVHKAASNIQPIVGDKYTLRLSNVNYADPETISKARHKQAILTGETLGRRLRGTWELLDNLSGKVLEKREQVVARVPHLSDMGTLTNRGNDYTVNHQQRLNSGVFARRKDNGEIESYVNVLPGKGVSHRYFLDPAKGVFKMKLGQSEMPLMPLLRALGTTDQEFLSAWGDKLYGSNYQADEGGVLKKLKQRLLSAKDQDDDNETSWRQKLVDKLGSMELNPEVTQRTLNKPHANLSKDAILEATKKLLAISRGEADVDDRDSLAYQTVFGPEDLMRERIERDHGRIRALTAKKIFQAASLAKMPSGLLTAQLDQAILGSGLGQAIEEINPAEVLDKQSRITRLGEGGIPSMESIPDEARDVQPSYSGFMDPIRTPESFRVGVDLHLSRNARKGRDGRLYTQMQGKDGQLVWKSAQDLADAAIATPDVMKWDTKRVPVNKGGKTLYVPKDQVDFVIPHYEDAFSPLGNLVPMKSASKGQRMAMASRYITQALPLLNAEAPLVQGALPEARDRSFEEEYAKHMGAVRADKGGRVMGVTPDGIQVQYEDGTKGEVELYNHFPFNRKTFIHQDATVQPGQMFKAGDLLAKSNYTDGSGTTALGLNARTAYVPWRGYNFEDAQAVSRSFAKRMASVHMYQHDVGVTSKHKLGLKTYVNMFPQKYDKKTLSKLDNNGIVRVGETVNYGEPLILAIKERDRAQNKIHKQRQAGYTDDSATWKHHDPGVVTDVVMGKSGPVVLVKSQSELQVGDKISGRYGDKGVVAAIIPDDQMPHDKDGNPFEVLVNSLGVISRTNPAQKLEAWLGKLAKVTGKPIKVPDFEEIEDLAAWTKQQLAQHGLSSTEDIVDPVKGRKISPVATGERFYMKLHHTAESKGQARGSGGYTMEETPAKGGETGSKRVSMMDVNALLSHGAVENLNDAGAVRGQKDEERWMQILQGYMPRDPRIPHTYQKFIHTLRASGIDVIQTGQQTNIMAMSNKVAKELTGDRFIKKGDTVNFDHELKPVAGGLFDPQLTGGHGGRRWSAISLYEPMPNPVMEEPIRRILGLTQREFDNVIGGDHELGNHGTGPAAIAKALGAVDLDKAISEARAQTKGGSMAQRDLANRRLGYLKSAKANGMEPKDWILDRCPVLPPIFRPVSMMGESGIPLISDPNYLYKELLDADDNLRQMHKEVGDDGIGDERRAVYHAFKAVQGLADPVHPKLQEKGVKGLLKSVFGNSPKFGMMQRKLLSSTVDNVGRAVITPNPDYDMDTVGLPEDKAFDVYSKFLVRRMKRRGLPIREALQQVKDRSSLARNMLLEEMEERPVYINRAPVLHRFGIMAFKPKLISGSVMQVSPLIVKGFNADFDGDAMQFHVPTSDAAIKEAYERMMPSSNLLSPGDFKTPMHMPGQEYHGGLYHASTAKRDGRVRHFRSEEDVERAWKSGEIGIDDEIKILA